MLPVLLAQLAAGHAVADLHIAYSDLHPLWGGISITVDGRGTWERHEWEPGDAASFSTSGTLSRDEMAALGRLLVDLEAWEQRTPDAAPVPDESRATLTIRAGEQATIWERFNELEAGLRIGRVRAWLLDACG